MQHLFEKMNEKNVSHLFSNVSYFQYDKTLIIILISVLYEFWVYFLIYRSGKLNNALLG